MLTLPQKCYKHCFFPLEQQGCSLAGDTSDKGPLVCR